MSSTTSCNQLIVGLTILLGIGWMTVCQAEVQVTSSDRQQQGQSSTFHPHNGVLPPISHAAALREKRMAKKQDDWLNRQVRDYEQGLAFGKRSVKKNKAAKKESVDYENFLSFGGKKRSGSDDDYQIMSFGRKRARSPEYVNMPFGK